MTLAISYVAAFILSALVNMIALLVLVPFKPLISRYRSLAPVAHFFYAFAGGGGAVWAFATLTQYTFLELSYFMLLVPAIFQLRNDMRRVYVSKQGLSGAKRALEEIGEPESYDQVTDVRSEQSAEYGRIVGFVVGMALFVGSAPYFG